MGGGTRYETPGMGANPPPDMAWQLGKTAASIRFVTEAERHITSGNASEDDIQLLREAVRAIRDGDRVLTAWVSVETFLVSGFPD